MENEEKTPRLIVAYGNPGKRFFKNKNNVGYMIVDSAIEKLKSLNPSAMTSNWAMRSKYMLMTTNLDPFTIVVKPRTFENKFDDTAFGLYRFYKVSPEDFFVILPDEDITLGQYKINKEGGNLPEPIQKVEKKIESSDCWKVRIGMGGASEELNELELTKIRFLGEKLADELGIIAL